MSNTPIDGDDDTTATCDIAAYEFKSALVDVYIRNSKMNVTPYEIGPQERIYPFYGINGGPVRVVSTNGVDIFTSQRVIYKNSFTETLPSPKTR